MKKIFCLILILFSASFMFGATIWIPRIHIYRTGVDDMIKFENVKDYHITNGGILFFRYNGKKYYSSIFVIEED